jgi:hypothetical protein
VGKGGLGQPCPNVHSPIHIPPGPAAQIAMIMIIMMKQNDHHDDHWHVLAGLHSRCTLPLVCNASAHTCPAHPRVPPPPPASGLQGPVHAGGDAAEAQGRRGARREGVRGAQGGRDACSRGRKKNLPIGYALHGILRGQHSEQVRLFAPRRAPARDCRHCPPPARHPRGQRQRRRHMGALSGQPPCPLCCRQAGRAPGRPPQRQGAAALDCAGRALAGVAGGARA